MKQCLQIWTVLLLFIMGAEVISAQEINGIVFRDGNHNLRYDPGERGIPNVIVSNQKDVVTTNRKGRYSLPVRDEMIIFITKPAGYTIPMNEHNLPQFYYIHQPAGSPEMEYEGVPPTGSLPEELNFPLYKVKEPNTFDVIMLSDPQPRDDQEISYIRDDVIAELMGTDAAFGLTLGDIMFDDLSLFSRQNEIFSALGIPFYNVPGNHDMNYDATDDRHALETFKSIFGPPYYAFEYGKVHFMVLDNITWNNPPDRDGYYVEKIGSEQLHWLREHMRFVPDDRLVVIGGHAPYVALDSADIQINVEDAADLFRILEDRRHVLMVAGHYHMLERIIVDEGLGWQGTRPFEHITLSAVSGSWWMGSEDERGIPIADQRDGTPNGYHIFTFRGTEYTQRFKPAYRDEDFQIRISTPKGRIPAEKLATSRVIANVFNAGPDWQVEFQCDNSGFKPMEKVLSIDPFIHNLYAQDSSFAKSWVEAQNTLHLWESPTPDGLTTGTHVITVRATDDQGNVFNTSRVIEVVKEGEGTVLNQ